MNETTRKILDIYHQDWVELATDVFGVYLDPDQAEILRAIQRNRRVSVRSGHARGKDFIAALAGLCWLYTHAVCKVIMTAPTGRQVENIMMAEIKSLCLKARIELGGRLLSDSIRFDENPDKFLLAFKAGDVAPETWTGFHSPNPMVIVTEATGLDELTYNAIRGLLTGNSRLFLAFNPHRRQGEAYQSTRNPQYKHFHLNCLNAPNVLAKETLIPGQVDWEWIDMMVKTPGLTLRITEEQIDQKQNDFEWDGQWYRPSDPFRVQVLGEFPIESEDVLIPLSWVEDANERWRKWHENGAKLPDVKKKLGVDVAGMGRDRTVFTNRYSHIIASFKAFSKQDHMVTVGKIKNELVDGGTAYIDSIGEGAGVYSRARELRLNTVSVKASEKAIGKTDRTGKRTFANMRSYLAWCLRDDLDPQFEPTLCIPPDPEVTEELTAFTWQYKSNGDIALDPKSEVRELIGRSPDYFDSICTTYCDDELLFPWL